MVSHPLDTIHAKAVEYQHPLHTAGNNGISGSQGRKVHTVGSSHGIKSSQIANKYVFMEKFFANCVNPVNHTHAHVQRTQNKGL